MGKKNKAERQRRNLLTEEFKEILRKSKDPDLDILEVSESHTDKIIREESKLQ